MHAGTFDRIDKSMREIFTYEDSVAYAMKSRHSTGIAPLTVSKEPRDVLKDDVRVIWGIDGSGAWVLASMMLAGRAWRASTDSAGFVPFPNPSLSLIAVNLRASGQNPLSRDLAVAEMGGDRSSW